MRVKVNVNDQVDIEYGWGYVTTHPGVYRLSCPKGENILIFVNQGFSSDVLIIPEQADYVLPTSGSNWKDRTFIKVPGDSVTITFSN